MVQGLSARENCPGAILAALLGHDLGFEQLVERTGFSRGTVNKYVEELFNEKQIGREGRRGFYCLTPKGRKEARGALMKQTLTQLPGSTLEEFVVKYKEIVACDIDDYFKSMDHELNRWTKEQIFTPSVIDKDLRKDFSEEELIKIWLIDKGSSIVQLIEKSGESRQQYILELKKKLQGKLS